METTHAVSSQQALPAGVANHRAYRLTSIDMLARAQTGGDFVAESDDSTRPVIHQNPSKMCNLAYTGPGNQGFFNG